jgi:hypothetical protein
MLNCTDIIPNTYIRSLTVIQIMASEKCGLRVIPGIVAGQLTCFISSP